jgi:hypothetical protein
MDCGSCQCRTLLFCGNLGMLAVRSPQFAFRTACYHIHRWNLLPLFRHWVWSQSDLGAATCYTRLNGYWNGLQGLNSTCLCRRELSSSYSRCSSYELADVDCFWYIPWLLCQLGRLQYWCYLVAFATRVGLYSSCPAGLGDFLLPR